MEITGERETIEWSKFLYTSMTNVLSYDQVSKENKRSKQTKKKTAN